MEFKTLKDAGEAYGKLQAVNATQAAEIDALKATIKQQHETIEDHVYETEELQALITELRTSKPVFGQPGFIHQRDGKHYEITASTFRHKEREFTAADVMCSEELQAELITLGVGFIVEKQEAETK